MLSPSDLRTIKDASNRSQVSKLNDKIYEIKPDDFIEITRRGVMVYEHTIKHELDNDQLLCRIAQLSKNKTRVSLDFLDSNTIKVSCVDRVHMILYISPDTYLDLSGITVDGKQGPKGDPGEKGEPGVDGREIELAVMDGAIKWRYAGQPLGEGWTEVISLSELKGESANAVDLIDDLADESTTDKTYSAKKINEMFKAHTSALEQTILEFNSVK